MATELEQIRDRLRRKLTVETRRLNLYDAYFEGEQPLKFMAPALQAELGDRLTALTLDLPRYAVAAYDDRLDVEGFRYPGQDATDDKLWQIYLQNDCDMLTQQVHQESLALSRSYMIVGPGEDEDDAPLITAESPFDTIHEDDPRTHDVKNGLHQWTELDGTRWATVYTPKGRQTWWRPKKAGDWNEDKPFVENEFESELCSLVPFINQPRMLGRLRVNVSDPRLGRSEFHGIIPVVDAVNKMATDMMVSGEFHAMPRRYVFGIDPEDFQGEDGEILDEWSKIAGHIWAHRNEKIKAGQFEESDLANFRDTVKLLVQLCGMLLALPPHYTGFETMNPPSADSIRSSEAQLVKRSERKQTFLGNRHGRVQRLVLAYQKQEDVKAREIQTVWRDPSTPTVAQKADATVKLVTAKDGRGRSLVPVEIAREDLGYTPEQRKRMKELDDEVDPAVAAASRELNTVGGGGAST